MVGYEEAEAQNGCMKSPVKGKPRWAVQCNMVTGGSGEDERQVNSRDNEEEERTLPLGG